MTETAGMMQYQETRRDRRLGGRRAPFPATTVAFPSRLRIVLACAGIGAVIGIAVRALYTILGGG